MNSKKMKEKVIHEIIEENQNLKTILFLLLINILIMPITGFFGFFFYDLTRIFFIEQIATIIGTTVSITIIIFLNNQLLKIIKDFPITKKVIKHKIVKVKK